MHQAQVSFEAGRNPGLSQWHIRAIPIPLAAGYVDGEQFLGGGTCSSDSSHDSNRVWDVLF